MQRKKAARVIKKHMKTVPPTYAEMDGTVCCPKLGPSSESCENLNSRGICRESRVYKTDIHELVVHCENSNTY